MKIAGVTLVVDRIKSSVISSKRKLPNVLD